MELVLTSIEVAGQMLIQETQRKGGVRGKGNKAAIDDEIDLYLRKTLNRAFPQDSIWSEECGMLEGSSGRCFWIDPHDGTKDFLLGHRETSISIALIEDNHFCLGVVHAPFSTPLTGSNGLLISCRDGNYLENHRKSVVLSEISHTLTVEDRILVTKRLSGQLLDKNRQIFEPAQLMYCSSIATRLALVAIGQASIGLTIHTLAAWDFAGGQALLQASGGDLFDQYADPITWQNNLPVNNASAYFGTRNPRLLKDLMPAIRENLLSK